MMCFVAKLDKYLAYAFSGVCPDDYDITEGESYNLLQNYILDLLENMHYVIYGWPFKLLWILADLKIDATDFSRKQRSFLHITHFVTPTLM